MQAQTISQMDQDLTIDLPAELDTAGAKMVYLALAAGDPSTVGDLRAQLNMGKLSLFPILRTLDDRDLVDRDGDHYVAH